MFGGCMWTVFQMNMWNVSRRHVKHSIWCVGLLYNMNRVILEPFLASAALKDISLALMHLYKQSPTSISLFFSSLHCICLHLLQASQPSTDWQTNWGLKLMEATGWLVLSTICVFYHVQTVYIRLTFPIGRWRRPWWCDTAIADQNSFKLSPQGEQQAVKLIWDRV